MKKNASISCLLFLISGLSSGKTLHFANIEHPVADKAKIVLTLAYKRLGIETKFVKVPVRRSLLASDSGNLDGEAIRIKEVLNHALNLRLVPTPIVSGKFHLFSRKKENYRGISPQKIS